MGLECFCEYDEKVLGRDGGDSYADTVHTLRATGRYPLRVVKMVNITSRIFYCNKKEIQEYFPQ